MSWLDRITAQRVAEQSLAERARAELEKIEKRAEAERQAIRARHDKDRAAIVGPFEAEAERHERKLLAEMKAAVRALLSEALEKETRGAARALMAGWRSWLDRLAEEVGRIPRDSHGDKTRWLVLEICDLIVEASPAAADAFDRQAFLGGGSLFSEHRTFRSYEALERAFRHDNPLDFLRALVDLHESLIALARKGVGPDSYHARRWHAQRSGGDVAAVDVEERQRKLAAQEEKAAARRAREQPAPVIVVDDGKLPPILDDLDDEDLDDEGPFASAG